MSRAGSGTEHLTLRFCCRSRKATHTSIPACRLPWSQLGADLTGSCVAATSGWMMLGRHHKAPRMLGIPDLRHIQGREAAVTWELRCALRSGDPRRSRCKTASRRARYRLAATPARGR